jgi:hypothetical protein
VSDGVKNAEPSLRSAATAALLWNVVSTVDSFGNVTCSAVQGFHGHGCGEMVGKGPSDGHGCGENVGDDAEGMGGGGTGDTDGIGGMDGIDGMTGGDGSTGSVPASVGDSSRWAGDGAGEGAHFGVEGHVEQSSTYGNVMQSQMHTQSPLLPPPPPPPPGRGSDTSLRLLRSTHEPRPLHTSFGSLVGHLDGGALTQSPPSKKHSATLHAGLHWSLPTSLTLHPCTAAHASVLGDTSSNDGMRAVMNVLAILVV